MADQLLKLAQLQCTQVFRGQPLRAFELEQQCEQLCGGGRRHRRPRDARQPALDWPR